jgi:tetratricopeptide (TPR) repeat protein
VVREKSHDYGIDLEVEIFTSEGLATGLTFLVQLKATDSPEGKVQREAALSVDHLRYYSSLDSPVLIFRWSSLSKIFYFKWANELYRDHLTSDAKMFRVAFTDQDMWSNASAALIERTIKQVREIEVMPAHHAIPVRLTFLALKNRFQVESTLASEIRVLGVVRSALPNAENDLSIECEIDDRYLTAKLGIMFSVRIQLTDIDSQLLSAFSYALALLMFKSGLRHHARSVAISILKRKRKSLGPDEALWAVRSLRPDLPAAIEMALLNGLETPSMIQPSLLIEFHSSPYREADRANSFMKFLSAAIEAAEKAGDRISIACGNYNAGRFLVSEGRPFKAIHYFNRARRENPRYLDRGYYRRELAGCLFDARRYRCAHSLYGSLGLEFDTPEDQICIADAALLSGNVGAAKIKYDKIVAAGESRLWAEAWVKATLCQALIKKSGLSILSVRISDGLYAINGSSERARAIYETVLRDIDAFNSLAAFNLGIAAAAEDEDFNSALTLFLIATLRRPGDEEAWRNAIICSLRISAEMTPTVLKVALYYAGEEVYRNVRRQIEGALSREVLNALDQGVSDLLAEIDSEREESLRVRVSFDDAYTHIFDVPLR